MHAVACVQLMPRTKGIGMPRKRSSSPLVPQKKGSTYDSDKEDESQPDSSTSASSSGVVGGVTTRGPSLKKLKAAVEDTKAKEIQAFTIPPKPAMLRAAAWH